VQRVVDAHHDVRRGGQLPEALGGERGDLAERLALQKLRHELSGNRHGKLNGLRLDALLGRDDAAGKALDRASDLLEGGGGVARRDRMALAFGRLEAVAEALLLRLGELERMLGRGNGLLRLGRARGEVLLEHEFGLRCHALHPQ
jgi:hypothetical protein